MPRWQGEAPSALVLALAQKKGFVTSLVLSFNPWKFNDRFSHASGEFCVSHAGGFLSLRRRGSTPKTGEAAKCCYRMPLYLCKVPLAAQGMARLTEHRGCPRALPRAGVHRACPGLPCR